MHEFEELGNIEYESENCNFIISPFSNSGKKPKETSKLVPERNSNQKGLIPEIKSILLYSIRGIFKS